VSNLSGADAGPMPPVQIAHQKRLLFQPRHPCSCNREWESTNNLALEVLRLLLEGCTTTPEG